MTGLEMVDTPGPRGGCGLGQNVYRGQSKRDPCEVMAGAGKAGHGTHASSLHAHAEPAWSPYPALGPGCNL